MNPTFEIPINNPEHFLRLTTKIYDQHMQVASDPLDLLDMELFGALVNYQIKARSKALSIRTVSSIIGEPGLQDHKSLNWFSTSQQNHLYYLTLEIRDILEGAFSLQPCKIEAYGFKPSLSKVA